MRDSRATPSLASETPKNEQLMKIDHGAEE